VSAADELLVVTGGIGTGKSTVTAILARLGWSVIDADDLARSILEACSEAVSHRWPWVVKDSVIDRSALARVVFSDPQELEALESIIHPSLASRLDKWAEITSEPAAVEVSSPSFLQRTANQRLVVDSPDDVRRSRALTRGMDADDLDRRISVQPTRRGWLQLATYVIENRDDMFATEVSLRVFDLWWRRS
jgi:dephospho-CoA kinase